MLSDGVGSDVLHIGNISQGWYWFRCPSLFEPLRCYNNETQLDIELTPLMHRLNFGFIFHYTEISFTSNLMDVNLADGAQVELLCQCHPSLDTCPLPPYITVCILSIMNFGAIEALSLP